MTNEVRAQELETKADKLIENGCWKKTEYQMQDISELYSKAANFYKMSKNYSKAASCFVRAGEILENIKDMSFQSANLYTDATKCFKMIPDNKEAVHFLNKSVQLLSENGNFSTAARLIKDIAELFEREASFKDAAIQYEKAADMFNTEDVKSSAQTCLAKAGECYAMATEYELGATVFEHAAEKAVQNSGLSARFAKDYMLKAVICILAVDLVAAKKLLEKWSTQDFDSQSSKEYQFMNQLIANIESNDEDAFTQTCGQYEYYIEGNWKTSALLAAKKSHFGLLLE